MNVCNVLLTVGVISFVIALISAYLLYRNNRVYLFYSRVLTLCKYSDNRNLCYGLYDKLPKYDKLLFSFKKLTLENFYNEKEITLLRQRSYFR